jgi:hypothetical protein
MVVNSVSGSWTVPAVTGSGTAYSSAWVGIDGFDSDSVEQIGTDSDLVNGQPQYYAWYEMYPRNMVEVPLTVHAGDSISASVAYTGSNQFTLSLTDGKQSYITSKTMKEAQRSSAEWIEEAPSSGSSVLPLADFGSVTFSNCSANIGTTTSTTSGPINNPWPNTTLYVMNMVSNGGATEDTTGALAAPTSGAGSTFSVAYQAPSTTPPPPQRHHHGWWAPMQPSPAASGAAADLSSAFGRGSAMKDRVLASLALWMV